MVTRKIKFCPKLFLISVFDPGISQGHFFGPIFRLQKVDLYMGKYGISFMKDVPFDYFCS